MNIGDFLAIVPARGGSVGIPKKNLQDLNGKPLFLHKLDQLREAGFQRVVCSTDDPDMKRIALDNGYEVHDRKETGGPDATIMDTVMEVVRDLNYKGPVAVAQVTCPTLGADRMREATNAFVADSAIRTANTVVPLHGIQWTADGQQLGARVNRQYGEAAVYSETGGLRLIKDTDILPNQVVDGAHQMIKLKETEAIDIDSIHQLEAARSMLGKV